MFTMGVPFQQLRTLHHLSPYHFCSTYNLRERAGTNPQVKSITQYVINIYRMIYVHDKIFFSDENT